MGLRDKILDVFPIINQSFNLPEGRDGFKSVNEGTISKWAIKVSIYPKAEMGLRAVKSNNVVNLAPRFQSTRRQRWV